MITKMIPNVLLWSQLNWTPNVASEKTVEFVKNVKTPLLVVVSSGAGSAMKDLA